MKELRSVIGRGFRCCYQSPCGGVRLAWTKPLQFAVFHLIALLGMLGGMMVAAGPATAEGPALPAYDGLMSFPTISASSDPEEYSWKVALGEGQSLESIDSQRAEVRHEDGTLAFEIHAGPAHDATGASVPTSLVVSGVDVITLIVHHRAGHPGSGVPFAYPVVEGEGWDDGFQTEVVVGPKDEQELKEERERIARERQEALEREWGRETGRSACLVPRLKGKSLNASKKLLRAAGCLIGNVRKLKGATARTGRVVKQHPRPNRSLELWATVDLTLAPRHAALPSPSE